MTPTAGLFALALGMIVFAGCSSTGYKKGDAAAWNLQASGGAVRAESRALEATTGALNDLINTPSGDLRLQFRRFSNALDELFKSSGRADRMAVRLEGKSADYFGAWDKQLLVINDDNVRKQSEARKLEAASQYEATVRRYHEAQDALAPLVDYLRDIRRALSADLTLAGLQAAKPTVNTANERAGKVQGQLAQSATELDALGSRMTSFVVPSAPSR